MSDTTFNREKKTDRPVIALCYDFDKTLSPDDMQAQGYIQTVQPEGSDMIGDFWRESNGRATANNMDKNLAYMYTMKKKARGQIVFTKEKLAEYGSQVALFPGVEDWFKRIRDYGADKGIIVEHYIISSGLKEMIEGTSIAKEFKELYATSFYFDDDGVADKVISNVNGFGDELLFFKKNNNNYHLVLKGSNFSEDGGERINDIKNQRVKNMRFL